MPPQKRPANTLLGVVGLIGFVTLVAIAAHFIEPRQPSGGWSKETRNKFIEGCANKCKNSPRVTADQYALCDKACSCSADEAEKIMTSAELVEYYLAEQAGLASNAQKQKMQRITAAGIACLSEAFGQKK
jgi:hypothetical protein